MKKKNVIILIVIVVTIVALFIVATYIKKHLKLKDNDEQYINFANLTNSDTKNFLNTSVEDYDKIKEIVSKLANGENLYKIELNKNEATQSTKVTVMYYEMAEGLEGQHIIYQNAIVMFGLIPDLSYITMSYRNDDYSANYDCMRDSFNYMYKKDNLSYYLTHQTRFEDEVVNNNLPKFYAPDRILYNNISDKGIYVFANEDKCFNTLVDKIYAQEKDMQTGLLTYETEESEDRILKAEKECIALDYYQEKQEYMNIKDVQYFDIKDEELKNLLNEEIKSKKAYTKENSKEIEGSIEVETIPEKYKNKLIEKSSGTIYEARLTSAKEIKEFEKAFKVNLGVEYKNNTTVIVTISKYKIGSIDWNIHKLEYNLSTLSNKYNAKVFVADELVNTKHLIYKTPANNYIKGIVKKIEKDTMFIESGLEYVQELYDTTTYENVNVIVDENTIIFNNVNSLDKITFLDIKEGDQVTVRSTKLAEGRENTIIANTIEVVRNYELENAKKMLKEKTYLDGSIISMNLNNEGEGEIVLSTNVTSNISIAVKINVTKNTKIDYLNDSKLENEKLNYYSITTVQFDSKIGDYETSIPTAKSVDIYDG